MSGSTLKPELLWIGREYCYRLNPLGGSESNGTTPPHHYQEQQQQQQQQQMRPVGQLEEEAATGGGGGGGCYNEDEVDAELAGCHVETHAANGGYRMRLPVPSAFHRFLIGRHGDAKRRLEAETGAELRIPRMGDTESPVLVLAKTRAQLASAKTRIELCLSGARERLPITHFLSLSLASEEVVARYEEFRDAVLRWCGGERGITEGVFQRPRRLHVTIVPLLLLTAPEVARARRMLDEFAKDRLPRLMAGSQPQPQPLRVTLSGLEIMNDDPSETRVLYARLHEATGRLQALADALAQLFRPLARSQPGRDGVKLHATLMNARYAADAADAADQQSGGGAAAAASFDASHLLGKFAGHDFGTASPELLQLSKASGGLRRDEYYACEHSVPLVG